MVAIELQNIHDTLAVWLDGCRQLWRTGEALVWGTSFPAVLPDSNSPSDFAGKLPGRIYGLASIGMVLAAFFVNLLPGLV